MGVRSKPVADDFQATAMSLWLVTINFTTHTLGFCRLPDVARWCVEGRFCSEMAIGALKTPKSFWPRGAHDRI